MHSIAIVDQALDVVQLEIRFEHGFTPQRGGGDRVVNMKEKTRESASKIVQEAFR
jgi:hypothetical protein